MTQAVRGRITGGVLEIRTVRAGGGATSAAPASSRPPVSPVCTPETVRQLMPAVSLILDFPFLLVFLAVMFAYSWQLTLIALGMLLVVAGLSWPWCPCCRAHQQAIPAPAHATRPSSPEYVAGWRP